MRLFGFNSRKSGQTSANKKPAKLRASMPLVEPLEGRTLLTAVVVNTILDQTDSPGSGTVSLRDAIAIANASTSPTTITFDPTVFATPQTIVLTQGTRLEMSQSTTITGPSAGVTVSGDDLTRIFYVDSGAAVSISSLTATDGHGNDNNGDGGGIFVSAGGNLTLSNVTLSDNTGAEGSHGGGLANYGTATLNDVTATGNTVSDIPDTLDSGQGGGIYNGGTITIQGGVVSDNTSGEGGGGIFNSGTATVSNISILSNTSLSTYGGGFQNQGFVNGYAAASLTDVTVAGNSAALSGGGIASDLGGQTSDGMTTLTLQNVTVTDNTAGQVGGGIWLDASNSDTSLIGVTVAGNSAADGGGGLSDLAGTGGAIGNTIIAGNSITGAGSTGPDVSGTVQSSGNNLIGQTDASTGWTGSDLTGTMAQPLNADLGSLADNGGPTETLLPQTGSPAIGAGSVALIPTGITTDQRGLPRTVNGKVDIGAVEVQSVAAPSTSTVSLALSSPTATLGTAVTLNATVAPASGSGPTPTGTVTFFSNGSNIGSGAVNGSGQAALTLSSLTAGSDNITASYSGDSNYSASSSSPETQTILSPSAVDLSDSVSFAGPASEQLKPGHSATIAVEVTNDGTATAKGKLAIVVSLSPNSGGSSPIDSITTSKNIHLAPGKHEVFRITTKVPVGSVPGTYFAVANVDPNNTFSESNITNNTAISSDTLTVLDPFPSLLGMWTDTIVATKGADKGLVSNQVIDFTSESDTTGAFSYTGTNYINGAPVSNFAAQGTISVDGAYTATGTGSAFTTKGRVVGDKIQGTIVSTIADYRYAGMFEG